MSYKPRSLFRLIEEMNHSLFLPHIQRPFVWELDQMRKLFDSLMLNYPIQTLLFWRTKSAIKARRFMDQVSWEIDLSTLYDAGKSRENVEKVFVLDGQQRLQTLYSLFAGGIATESSTGTLEAWARITAGDFLPDDGMMYPLRFEKQSPGVEWYRLRNLREADSALNSEEVADKINDALDSSPLDVGEMRTQRQRRVRKNVGQLGSLLREEKHFWVQELDGVANAFPYKTVLNIFVRVNSGGTRLEAADLMFAAMKEKWSEIEERVEEVARMLNASQLGFDKSLVLNRDRIVEVLLPTVRQAVPTYWRKQISGEVSDAKLRTLLDRALAKAFGGAEKHIKAMKVRVLFKGVTFESLTDPDFVEVAKERLPALEELHREFIAVQAESVPVGRKETKA